MINLTLATFGLFFQNSLTSYTETLPLAKLVEAVYNEDPEALTVLLDAWVHDYRNAVVEQAFIHDRENIAHEEVGSAELTMMIPALEGQDDYNLVLGALIMKSPYMSFFIDVYLKKTV